MAPLPRCPKLWHFARVTALGWCPQNGWTPLGIAAFKKHRGVCLALLEAGAKLELVAQVGAALALAPEDVMVCTDARMPSVRSCARRGGKPHWTRALNWLG